MPRDFQAFHRSLGAELTSVKDRIRNLIDHWPSDGEHKEVVLQAVLRRHIGQSFVVGKGFIVDQNSASGQIDLMVIDGASPTLFRDGDFLITTPDAVRAVIEVKTSCTGPQQIAEATEQLRQHVSPWDGADRCRIWTGLFIYEREPNENTMRNHMKTLANGNGRQRCPVNCVSIGENDLIRWWPKLGGPPFAGARRQVWRSYELAGLAPAYFVGNLIEHLTCTADQRVGHLRHGSVWFPIRNPGGKERHAQLEIASGQADVQEATQPDRQEELNDERNGTLPLMDE